MKKLTYKAGGLTITDYKPEVKFSLQPKILDTFINDEGEKVLVLDNGRETLADRYAAVWGRAIQKIMPKGYKGTNCDTRPIT